MVVVVGGGIVVYGQTYSKPQVVQMENISATKDTISFSLLIGDDLEKINSGEEDTECNVTVELTCETYENFKQELAVEKYGRFDSQFVELTPETEYTINVYQHQLVDIDYDYLMDPIKFSTTKGETVIAPSSFSLSPDNIRIEEEQTVTLSIVDLMPADADTSVTWSSSDPSIASVSSSGVVTGVLTSNDPVTIIARSTLVDTVYATATVYVDPASPSYKPQFDIVNDPFDEVLLYGYFEVAHESRNILYPKLMFTELDRDTGEPIQEDNIGYCNIDTASIPLTERRQIKVSDMRTEMNYDGLYSVDLRGYIEVEVNSGGSMMTDYQEVVLYQDKVDFVTVPRTQVGTSDYTNQIYFRRHQVYGDSVGYIEQLSYFETYIDVNPETGVETGDGTAVQEKEDILYVGIFNSSEAEPNYGGKTGDNVGNAYETFEIIGAGNIQKVEKDLSSFAESEEDFKVIVYRENLDGNLEEVFSQMVDFSSINSDETVFIESLSFSLGTGFIDSDYNGGTKYNKRITLNITSDYLNEIDNDSSKRWLVDIYDITQGSEVSVASNLSFSLLGGWEGRINKYVYDCDAGSEPYQTLSEEGDKWYRLNIKAAFGANENLTLVSTYDVSFNADSITKVDGSADFSLDPTSSTSNISYVYAAVYISNDLFSHYSKVTICGEVADELSDDAKQSFEVEITEDGWPTAPVVYITDENNERITVNARFIDNLDFSYEICGYKSVEGQSDLVRYTIFSESQSNLS